jgi:hypothetical protein
MSENIKFRIPNENDLVASIRRLLCAGYTARNRADVEAHIKELTAIGIGAPPHVPMLFPIMPASAS